MRRVATSLSLWLALVSAPGVACATNTGGGYGGPVVVGIVVVFLAGVTATVLTPYIYTGVETGDGLGLSTSAATAFTLIGGVFGGATTRSLVLSRNAPSETGVGAFWGALAPPFVGVAGLGVGGYGPRPRDPWIGATTAVTALTATHAALAWAGRGNEPASLVVGATFGGLNTAGAAALALTAETETESALLWASAGLSLAGTVSLAITHATQRPIAPPAARGQRAASLSWSAGPLGRGAGLFVSGLF